MAWDWISRKLYWTDTEKQTLEVMDVATGYRKVLLRFEDGTVPRVLILDPVRR